MNPILRLAARVFDSVETAWEGDRAQRIVGFFVVAAFLLGLLGIELNRRELLPPAIAALTPRSHYFAINLAFTLLLFLEGMALIFSMAKSISKSVGKQFEILSIILVRMSFEELVNFGEPLDTTQHVSSLLAIGANGLGALAIFVCLGFYYRLQPHRPISIPPTERAAFIAKKKLIALTILMLFIWLAIDSLSSFLLRQASFDFFETFYTILIFSDIMIILVSIRYLPTYHAIFRNSGFALSTLLIRMALTAQPFYNAVIGAGSALFAVGLSLAFIAFSRPSAVRAEAEQPRDLS